MEDRKRDVQIWEVPKYVAGNTDYVSFSENPEKFVES